MALLCLLLHMHPLCLLLDSVPLSPLLRTLWRQCGTTLTAAPTTPTRTPTLTSPGVPSLFCEPCSAALRCTAGLPSCRCLRALAGVAHVLPCPLPVCLPGPCLSDHPSLHLLPCICVTLVGAGAPAWAMVSKPAVAAWADPCLRFFAECFTLASQCALPSPHVCAPGWPPPHASSCPRSRSHTPAPTL